MINKKLNLFISDCLQHFDSINEERKGELLKLSTFISERKAENTALIFICVHNSRRSHLSQCWAQVAAYHFGQTQISAYSGGTEVTEMYPAIAETLTEQGFEITQLSTGKNPVYSLKYAVNQHPIIGFSKMYDSTFNPQSNFGAIMVCSSADDNCPYISTAALRVLLPFTDPKESDGTKEQKATYLARSKQIATEMLYVFSKV